MTTVVPEAWYPGLARLEAGTLLVVGATGSGKSRLARHLVGQLQREGGRVALLSADLGQASVGVPGCLGLALTRPWEAPSALWFVGDFSAQGHFLPLVVGAARLASRAREAGARAVVVDSMGWVAGAAARALHHHLAEAAGVDQVVALTGGEGLEALVSLLDTPTREVIRLPPSPLARERPAAERRRYRQERLRAHFAGARAVSLPREALVSSSWEPVGTVAPLPPPGTLLGLLDAEGFCLALGIVEGAAGQSLQVVTAWGDAGAVARVQAGTARLRRDPQGEIEEG
jgi:polynucleotide 5'-hydroxyl-kinase GRC3/NOL9